MIFLCLHFSSRLNGTAAFKVSCQKLLVYSCRAGFPWTSSLSISTRLSFPNALARLFENSDFSAQKYSRPYPTFHLQSDRSFELGASALTRPMRHFHASLRPLVFITCERNKGGLISSWKTFVVTVITFCCCCILGQDVCMRLKSKYSLTTAALAACVLPSFTLNFFAGQIVFGHVYCSSSSSSHHFAMIFEQSMSNQTAVVLLLVSTQATFLYLLSILFYIT